MSHSEMKRSCSAIRMLFLTGSLTFAAIAPAFLAACSGPAEVGRSSKPESPPPSPPSDASIHVAKPAESARPPDQTKTDASAQGPSAEAKPAQRRPKLLDLGASKCIPCRMMAPILDDLKETYQGRVDVEFIDVWKDAEAGKRYGIRSIPTQIFYNAEGKELFRHEGFLSREEILGKWKELGVDLGEVEPRK